MSRQLDDEEGVSFRLDDHAPQLRAGEIDVERGEQPRRVLRREPLEVESVLDDVASEIGERFGERMRRIELGVAIGGDEGDVGASSGPGEVTKQQE